MAEDWSKIASIEDRHDQEERMTYALPPLPYAYSALEPYLDEQTMHVHHDGHHKAYVDKLNAALEQYPALQQKSIQALLHDLATAPAEIRTAVKNNAGGHANHTLFWSILKKDVQPQNAAQLMIALNKQFGSFEQFKELFTKTANGFFGSGYTWLVMSKEGLEIMTTTNQDSPLSIGKTPLLCIDLWEHAYYLKYQNKRAEFVTIFFNIINWDEVERLYLDAQKQG
jgi:superoxide dismutase, Fe-Mn family